MKKICLVCEDHDGVFHQTVSLPWRVTEVMSITEIADHLFEVRDDMRASEDYESIELYSLEDGELVELLVDMTYWFDQDRCLDDDELDGLLRQDGYFEEDENESA